MTVEHIEHLSPRLQILVRDTRALLEQAVREHQDVVYSNSLGAEAMVLTDIIAANVPEIEMFTLDTGRLHDETLALLDRLERRYQRRIQVFYPDAHAIEQYVRDNGINGFYLGLEERLSCCEIRKVEPFKRAIVGRKAWVTGVRREQSAERTREHRRKAAGIAICGHEPYELEHHDQRPGWGDAPRLGRCSWQGRSLAISQESAGYGRTGTAACHSASTCLTAIWSNSPPSCRRRRCCTG